MAQLDYRGARGSNAGDDFHELWALRRCLNLLRPDADLSGLTVEGLSAEDEHGTPADTWDGVDSALYFNGDSVASAERIEIIQFKYSAADPDAPWTIARLVRSSAKKTNNSVVRRLAVAFKETKAKRNGSVNGITIQFTSNQPPDPRAMEVLRRAQTGLNTGGALVEENELRNASGLDEMDFRLFAQALELSRARSRFALEGNVLQTIAGWTEGDARSILNDLLRFMRTMMMMPESKGEWIGRETILAQLGFSSFSALFPCRSDIKEIENLIPRQVSSEVVEQMLGGTQYLCIHGGAGSGKTTLLQEIRRLLPAGSSMVVFDCYGAGRYLDSDAYRHRPKDAFFQLSNELAVRLQVPLLLTRAEDVDYPQAFHTRLTRASEALAASSPEALLVVVVDAADNSIAAAKSFTPEETSFVREFVRLGNLPSNVRFMVTARTGRLSDLELPAKFVPFPVEGFTSEETAAHVRSVWQGAPPSWIEDFHHLSNQNPRVQHYALQQAGSAPQVALDYLRPAGKVLDDVFSARIAEAQAKIGSPAPLARFCAALIALTHPAPFPDLAEISGLSIPALKDVCADLAPGVRVTAGGVGFADEDFEAFIRAESAAGLADAAKRMAEWFMRNRQSSPYAARHLGTALYKASRGRELIVLVESETEASIIADPMLRREVRFERLRVALQVCGETDDQASLLKLILIGAEAMRGDQAIFNLIRKFPDLACAFMRESVTRLVLRDSDQIAYHGPLLFHLLREDAANGNRIAAREDWRQLNAWLQRRKRELTRPESAYHVGDWSIASQDIAAEVEAAVCTAGVRFAGETLRRWRPRQLSLTVARIVV
jgi:hypothetical protein